MCLFLGGKALSIAARYAIRWFIDLQREIKKNSRRITALEDTVHAKRKYSVTAAICDGVIFGLISAVIFGGLIGWAIADAFTLSKLEFVLIGAIGNLMGVLFAAVVSCLITVLFMSDEIGLVDAGKQIGVLSGAISAILIVNPILTIALQRFNEINT